MGGWAFLIKMSCNVQKNQVGKLAFVANLLFFLLAVADFACCYSVVTYLKREKVFSEFSKFMQWFGFLNDVLQWRQRWEGGYSRGYLVQLRLFAVSIDSLVWTKCKKVTKNITMKHWTASASTTTRNIQKQPPRTGEPQLAECWRAYRLLTGNSVLEVELVSFQSTQLLTRRWKPREATILLRGLIDSWDKLWKSPEVEARQLEDNGMGGNLKIFYQLYNMRFPLDGYTEFKQ